MTSTMTTSPPPAATTTAPPAPRLAGQYDLMGELQAALHVYDYAAWIPEMHVRVFMRALGCLSQIGPDVVIEANDSGVILRTLSQSRSSFAQIILDKKRFFEVAEFSQHVRKQSGNNPCNLKVLANLKACIMPLKNPQGLILALSHSQSSIAFISVFSGGRSRSTYVVRAEPQTEALQAQFQRGSTHNELSGRVLLFTRFLQGTQKAHRELSFECTVQMAADGGPTGAVTLRSYSDDIKSTPLPDSKSGTNTQASDRKVLTEYSYAAEELESFEVTREYIANPRAISVSLKEVKALIGFIDMMHPKEGSFHIWFDSPGLPVLFSNCPTDVENSPIGLQCDLIMTSTTRDDDQSVPQASQELHANLRQAQMSQAQLQPAQSQQQLQPQPPQPQMQMQHSLSIKRPEVRQDTTSAETSSNTKSYQAPIPQPQPQHQIPQPQASQALSSQELPITRDRRPESSPPVVQVGPPHTRPSKPEATETKMPSTTMTDQQRSRNEQPENMLGLGRPRHRRQGGEEAEEEQEEAERLQHEHTLAAHAYHPQDHYYQDQVAAGGYAYPAPEDHGEYYAQDEYGHYPGYGYAGGEYGYPPANGEQFYADDDDSGYHSTVFQSRARRGRMRDEDVDDYYE